MKHSIKRTLVLISLLAACALPVHAANYFAQNQTVDNVVNPGRIQQQGQVEVVEFFWYGCPHCAAFEPDLNKWVKQLPSQARFLRVPASWNESMSNQQRLFYTLETLNRLDLHSKVFADIHKKHVKLNTPAEMAKWASAQKINAAQWKSAFNSAVVDDKVNAAQAAYKRFEFNWVPVIVINGKRVVAFTPNILNDAQTTVQEELNSKP